MANNQCKIKKRCGKTMRLFKKQFGKCFYCGNDMRFFRNSANNVIPKDYCTKDHVIPRAKGGKGNIENLVAACFSCNVKKGNSTDIS